MPDLHLYEYLYVIINSYAGLSVVFSGRCSHSTGAIQGFPTKNPRKGNQGLTKDLEKAGMSWGDSHRAPEDEEEGACGNASQTEACLNTEQRYS